MLLNRTFRQGRTWSTELAFSPTSNSRSCSMIVKGAFTKGLARLCRFKKFSYESCNIVTSVSGEH